MSAADEIAEIKKLREVEEINKLRSAKSDVAPPKEKLGGLYSTAAGAVQGITGNFGDEISGVGNALIDKAIGEPGTFGELYEKRRDQSRAYNKAAQEENPKLYLGGNVGGTLATGLVPGMGTLKAVGGTGLAAKGLQVAKTAAQTGALGGLFAAGESEANPFRSPDEAVNFAKDVGKGTAIGGTLGAAGSIGSQAFKALSPSSLRGFAERKATTAAGFMAKDLNKLSPTQRQEVGRALLDNKVVTALSSLEDVAERSGNIKQIAGEQIGSALSTVDNHVKDIVSGINSGRILTGANDAEKNIAKKFITDNFQFNMQNVGHRIRTEIIEPQIDNPLLSKELENLSHLASDFSSKGSKSLSFGNIIKATQGKQTRFQSETVPEVFKQDVYRILKEEIENTVAKTGNLESGISALGLAPQQSIGGLSDIAARNSKTLDAYKNAKNLYGAMAATENASLDRIGKVGNNRSFSLTDTIAAGAGFASGGAAPAVILGGLNKISRKYGATTQAVGADLLAKGIEAVQGVTTDQLAKAIGSVVSKSPELAQKVGGVLAKAATEGKISLVAVHYALMKDPQYAREFKDESQSGNVFQRRLGR